MLGLTLRQIRYFIAVAETGSITRAAAAVNISQSAITEAIKALEGQLGTRLVERRARGIVLTHAGHQFVRHARTIMSAVADAAFAVGRSAVRRQGHVAIGVTHIVAGYFLADPLARFRRVFPGITHSVVEDYRRYIAHLLINGELDLGAVVLSDLEESDALEHRLLLRSRHRLWLAPNHPLLAREQIRLADLAAEPLIALAVGECRELGERLWSQAGLRPRLHLATTSVEAVRSLVATGRASRCCPTCSIAPGRSRATGSRRATSWTRRRRSTSASSGDAVRRCPRRRSSSATSSSKRGPAWSPDSDHSNLPKSRIEISNFTKDAAEP